MKEHSPYKEILKFSKTKKLVAIPLLLLGILGLFLPVIPGLALIFLAVFLLLPKESEKLLDKIKKTIAKEQSSS